MTRVFEVVPKVRLGPLRLGMTREDVRAILGVPEYSEAAYEQHGISFRDKDCYFDSCIQIRYDESHRVEDIQASAHPSFTVRIAGVSVLEVPPPDAASPFEALGPLNREDREFPSVYAFPSIGISFWRAVESSPVFDTINVTHPNA